MRLTGFFSAPAAAAACLLLLVACDDTDKPGPASASSERPVAGSTTTLLETEMEIAEIPVAKPQADERTEQRAAMVSRQLIARDIRDERVLDAMRRVPRHLFIPENRRGRAYGDPPIPIGLEQTISQPYIVAFMTQVLKLKPTDRVLEIGTGSGYQAAILGELVRDVYTIEILPELGQRSARLLTRLGYRNVHVRVGDGFKGWPEEAPFDAIIVTAAPPRLPQPLLDQLKLGGRMIIPVGNDSQELVFIRRTKNGLVKQNVLPVAFVPMTGEVQRQAEPSKPRDD